MKRQLLVYLIFSLVIIFFNCEKNQQNLKIGIVLPLTGDIAPYGQSSKMGMNIAINEDRSSNNKLKITYLFEDGVGNSRASVNAIKKLINVDQVPIVLGGLASSIALAMSPIAEESHTVLMCPFASSPKITNAGDYIFRIMPSDAFQAALLPKWFDELGYKNVGIIYVQNDWGESLKSQFIQNFEELGGKIVFEESCIEGSKDVRNIVAKLISNKGKIDALFLPTYPEEGGLLLKQIKEAGINIPIFGGDTWANDLLVKIAGEAAEGVRFLAPMQYEGKEYQMFREKYSEQYQKEPDLPAAAGYDAMKVILYCIGNLQKEGHVITADAVKNSLYKVSGFHGATGITTFDKNGDVISKEFARRIIKNGKISNYE